MILLVLALFLLASIALYSLWMYIRKDRELQMMTYWNEHHALKAKEYKEEKTKLMSEVIKLHQTLNRGNYGKVEKDQQET